MNTPTRLNSSHQEVLELLPWFVNGTLGGSDLARVEAHLQECGACREEEALQRRVCAALAADSPVQQLPAASLNRLRQRIDRHERVPRVPRRRPLAAAVAATVLIAGLVVGVPSAYYWQRQVRAGDAASYFTVTSAAPQHPQAVIRAVFAPMVTLRDLQGLLDDARLRIVAGPTEAGVYSLAMNGAESTAWSLQRLRAHAGVRFAEAITPEPAPPP